MSMPQRIPEDDNSDWSIWLQRFRLSLRLEGMADRTILDRTRLLRQFFNWCESLGITGPIGLTVAILEDWRRFRIERVNARGKRDQAFTVNTHVKAARKFCRFLVERGVLPMSILAGLKYMKTPRLLPRVTPAHADVVKILESVPADTPVHVRDRAILELVYSSAIRRGELASLTVEDLDLAGGLVRVTHGKGGKERMAPMGAHARHWLQVYVQSVRPSLLRGKPDEHRRLFVSQRGNPLIPEEITQIVARCARRAGMKTLVGPHALRRSCATEMIRNGANPAHVKDILGHEDFQSIQAYVKLAAVDLKIALAKYHPRERTDRR
jgi:integrase/recombinase XerD